jgi:hypothetical protein
MNNNIPLYLYLNEEWKWMTDKRELIPKWAEVQTIHTTRERVDEILEKSDYSEYKNIYDAMRSKYRKKVFFILQNWYNLPDVNWSECNIDD